jgi:hypothetical protein
MYALSSDFSAKSTVSSDSISSLLKINIAACSFPASRESYIKAQN